MKTKILMGMVCLFISLTSINLGAQVTLKNGEYFGFQGDYELKDGDGGLYSLFVWGTEGEFEGELTFKSKTVSYKIKCTAKYVEGANEILYLSFDKVLSGSFPQKAEMAESSKLFALALLDGDFVVEHMVTVMDGIKFAGFEIPGATRDGFKKLESEGTEGPP